MQGANLTTAAIAFSIGSAYMAAAEEGIFVPDRVRTFFASDQMTDPIPTTRECTLEMIENYLGEGITIVHQFDRVSGFRNEEGLREDITAVFAGDKVVQLSLNVTQELDDYVFPYSLLAIVDYNGSGRIDTFYYPKSNLPNPAEILAGRDWELRHCPS